MIAISFLCNSNPYSLLLLSSCLFQRHSNGHRGAALRQGMRRDANATRSATVSDGTGPTRSLSLSDTFPAFALWLHRVPGVGRNGTGRGRHGQRQQRDQRGRQQQRGKDTRYACCYFLSLFLYFHLFFISLFFFSDYFFSGKYNNRRGAKGKGRSDGTGHTRAAITTWDNTEGADGGTSSFCFVLWTLLDYFYHFSSFPIISFSVEYNNMRPGRGRPTRAAMATSNGTGRERARQVRLLSSVTVFLPTLLFSSSHFYYLFCRKLKQQTRRGRVGLDRTGRRRR